MSDKKIRASELSKIHPYAAMDHRNFLNSDGSHSLLENLPRKERRKLAAEGKRISRKYAKIINKLIESGVKFPADKVLREFAKEYTHRYASSGIYNQPVSFNYFEAFLHIKLIENSAPYTEIEQEFNHLFHATDFFDYLTSASSGSFTMSSLLDLPQDQIYHFSTCGEVTDISFLNGDAREFVVAGFSMIRRGCSLHWYLIGGEALSQEEWELRDDDQSKINIDDVAIQKQAFLSQEIEERGGKTGKPISLEGTDRHLRTVIAGEFDIKEEKHVSRCCLAEYENSFNVICDDPELLIPFEGTEKGEMLKSTMVAQFNRTSVLWSLAEGLFQLPSYFESRLALSKETSNGVRRRVSKKKGGKGLSSEYVVIPALETNSTAPTSTITVVRLPQYQIETDGHWKRLTDSEKGMDRHGNSVIGKTWIASSSKWKPKNSSTASVFLKDTLTAAELKIAEYMAAVQQTADSTSVYDPSNEVDCGELYIMRCAAMKEQVYKVGYTEGKAFDRAKKLSSTTGVPLAFVVMKSWRHKEAKKLETDVHMMLSPYRINDAREFFQLDFSVIEHVIETVLRRSEF